MRGRLIFAFQAQLFRLDNQGMAVDPGYDPDFKEPIPVDVDGDGQCDRLRSEHPPVLIPCQVDTKAFEDLRMQPSGDAPRSTLELVFHFRDLERLAMVDSQTGQALIRPGDRLGGLYDKSGVLVQAVRTPPGLYVTEAKPIGFGLGMARPRRNLLHVSFKDRQQAPGRVR